RCLSGADAVHALRPFYLAVHPDFFAQYPKEREVNENSLKRLNGYLDNLQRPGPASAQPVTLTFYMRDTQDLVAQAGPGTLGSGRSPRFLSSPLISAPLSPPSWSLGFRTVSFTLQTKDVLSTVTDILKSCSLPVEHMSGLKSSRETSGRAPEAAEPFYRPIKWDKSYYSFTGFRDPEEDLQRARRAEPTLSSWLRDNEAEAARRHRSSLPRREELSRLQKELSLSFGLADIRWQRGWSLAHRCCQLQSLSRLAQQSPEALVHLQGHTLVFADQSGMNASGHVMLGTVDVHHQWTKLFQQLSVYRRLQQQSDWLKERIGLLLGGVQVLHLERFGPAQPILEHLGDLSLFHKSLISHPRHLHPRSLRGLAALLDSSHSHPSLHDAGHFIIPPSFGPPKLQLFLQRHAHEARERTQRQNLLQAEEEAVRTLCVQGLSLTSLSKDPSIASSQMILCCQRLAEQPRPHMRGLHICVSRFFSVMQDGELCIPWDWE
ncbi:unnamed protein product, partial [Tetraodon nigroviridis]